MINRPQFENALRQALARSRAVVLVGPRQVGKTTLAKGWLPSDHPNYFDLESIEDRARLENPQLALSSLENLVVIDEVQNAPDLFAVLRTLIDRSDQKGQFFLLGSASPALLRQSSESLLGRVEVIEVTGFNLDEAGVMRQNDLWNRGGFPPSFTASSDADSYAWRENAIARHVEVDLRQFGIDLPAPTMLRFWRMLAHYHGQIWNAAELARAFGVSEPTVRKYLDILTQTYMVRQLQPWHQNLSKRQVKSPKIYLRDTGLLHTLLGIRSTSDLLAHPASGASWEGFALEQVIRISKPDEAYFWATHASAELDLLLIRGRTRIGVEFKRSDAPTVSRSMQIAIDDLMLDKLYVVYPGQHRYRLNERIEAVPLWSLLPDRALDDTAGLASIKQRQKHG
jgi:uncharacterized protein